MADKSECCKADIKIANYEPEEEQRKVKEIFYFRCIKCRQLCHLMKKYDKRN